MFTSNRKSTEEIYDEIIPTILKPKELRVIFNQDLFHALFCPTNRCEQWLMLIMCISLLGEIALITVLAATEQVVLSIFQSPFSKDNNTASIISDIFMMSFFCAAIAKIIKTSMNRGCCQRCTFFYKDQKKSYTSNYSYLSCISEEKSEKTTNKSSIVGSSLALSIDFTSASELAIIHGNKL